MNREPAPDLAIGSFTDRGPWVVEPECMAWRGDVDRLREQARGQVPRWLETGHLPPLGRLVRVTGRVGAALGIWAVGARRRGAPYSRRDLSRRLRSAFAHLGPTYIKLGQIVSGGEGLFPEELVAEFKLLRDRVPPEPFDAVRRVVELDLGRSLDDIFSSFARVPVAAASIAQVHAATLRTGEDVVVKVQRPQIARLVREDIEAMAWLAPHLVGRIPVAALANPPALVELFAETVIEELDFRLEAQNMLDIAHVLAVTNQRAIIVPRPHPTMVTRRVLVMERLSGFAFDDVEGMRAAGIDTHALLQAGLIASLEGAMIYGVFHGDLHGGNLVVQPDGTTALFDFGMTGRLTEFQRVAFMRLLMFGTTGDQRAQLAALRDLGAFPPDVDLEQLAVDLQIDGPVKDPTQMSADDLMLEMREVTKKLLAHGARVPKELMLFVKNTMFLNSATAVLAPDLDMIQQMMAIYMYFASTHGDRILREVGIDATQAQPDTDAMKAAFLVDSEADTLTFRELQARREQVKDKLAKRRKRGRRVS